MKNFCSVHPAAHPPPRSTAAAHPAPEPHGEVLQQPAAAKVLAALLDKLRSACARGHRGNLSLVKSMTIDDATIRADLCGVGVAEVRSDVQAVRLAVPLSEAAVWARNASVRVQARDPSLPPRLRRISAPAV
jgi:hypothetical protein